MTLPPLTLPTAPGEPPSRRRRYGPRWVLAGVGLAIILFFTWLGTGRRHAPSGVPSAGSARPVPVTAVPATRRDVFIYLDGLGSVVALKTVTVKTQVDGQLQQVLFQEGQFVRRGEVLAQIDPRPFAIQLAQAEAALARDTAQHREAKLNADRFHALRQQKLISQQQFDDQRATSDQLFATLGVDRAQINNARLMLDYARIKSPIDGVTGVRLIDPGNVVHAADNTGIVVLTQLDPIAVLFTLPEDDLPRVVQAQAEGPVAVEALSRDGATKLAVGHLLLIDNQINQATATLRLKAEFPNPNRALWPNAFVKARLLASTRRGAVTVPSGAVQRGPQGTYVYLVGPGDTAVIRPVKVELTQAETSIIQSGLAAGERVIVEGQAQLKPGAAVSPRPPSGAPAAESSAHSPGGDAAP